MNLAEIKTRNFVKIHGENNEIPMLLAHGFGVDQGIWRLLTEKFSQKYKVIAFDYVGCGQSDKTFFTIDRYSSLDGYVQDLVDICMALEVRNGIFVGHSISCMVGLLATIEYPDLFSKLVFIAPSPCYVSERHSGYQGSFDKEEIVKILDHMDKDYIGWSNNAVPSIVNSESPELTQEILNKFLANDQKIARQFAETTFFTDNRRELLKMTKPCLILQCSEDIMAPLTTGDYLHAHLQRSSLKILKCKGHFPQLTASEEVAEVISEYLSPPVQGQHFSIGGVSK